MSRTLLISPHFDDIAYSLGGFIISKPEFDFKIITCFSISNYCPCLNFVSIEDISMVRLKEEKHFAEKVKSAVTTLGFQEALLRGYTITSIFTSTPNEVQLAQDIEASIEYEIKKLDAHTIFCPLGIGNHVDHLIVKSVIEKLAAKYPHILINYYEELPYCGFLTDAEYSNIRQNEAHGLKEVHTGQGDWFDDKITLLRGYTSQVTEADIQRVNHHYNRIAGERYYTCQ